MALAVCVQLWCLMHYSGLVKWFFCKSIKTVNVTVEKQSRVAFNKRTQLDKRKSMNTPITPDINSNSNVTEVHREKEMQIQNRQMISMEN